MRILILGPVVNKRSSGGVAVFDESLYDGFRSLGDDVNIISISKSDRIDNIVIGNGKKSASQIPFMAHKIANLIKMFRPDIVISSLQYSIGIKAYKRKYRFANYIQVLHGYPCPINGKLKSNIVNAVARYSRRHFDFLTTVSYISYAINKQINGIICDKIIHNCIDFPFSENICEKKEYDFVFVGRLHPDKNIEMIGDALLKLKKKCPSIKVCFAGYGELESLFTNGKFAKEKSGFDYYGKIDHKKVSELLQKSKFFISLAPNEAFGIVFAEAVANGCNVITNITAGISELLYNKPYFHCTKAIDYSSLLDDLSLIVNRYHCISKEERKQFAEYMSSTRMAKDYKELVFQKEEQE